MVLIDYDGEQLSHAVQVLVGHGEFTVQRRIRDDPPTVNIVMDDESDPPDETAILAILVADKSSELSAASKERDKRIALGVTVTLPDGETFVAQTRNEKDFRNINGLTTKGALLLMNGDTTTTVTFRSADDTDHVLNSQLLVLMGQQVGNAVDEIYKKCWAIKDAIKDGSWSGDVTDDQHWT